MDILVVIINIVIFTLIIKAVINWNKKYEVNIQYSVLDLAKYIASNYSVNNIKLQKVLLYLQIQYMKRYHSLLFQEEFTLQGNYYIIDIVYKFFCGFGSIPIFYSSFILEVPLQSFIKDELNNTLEREIDEAYNQLYLLKKDKITNNDLIKMFINNK